MDDQMKTDLNGIYAAGDLIEHRGRFYGIWPAAMEQGKVAGAAMAGQDVRYEGTVVSNTLKVVGIDLFSAGEIDLEGTLESIVIKDEARNITGSWSSKKMFSWERYCWGIFAAAPRFNKRLREA